MVGRIEGFSDNNGFLRGNCAVQNANASGYFFYFCAHLAVFDVLQQLPVPKVL